MKRQIVEQGFGYKIYYYRETYFVEVVCNHRFCEGFDTLHGAKEHAYYMGFRDSKD